MIRQCFTCPFSLFLMIITQNQEVATFCHAFTNLSWKISVSTFMYVQDVQDISYKRSVCLVIYRDFHILFHKFFFSISTWTQRFLKLRWVHILTNVRVYAHWVEVLINYHGSWVFVRREWHINFSTQCVIMMQRRWPLTPCHMHYSQDFDKIDSFLRSVLDIFIIRNLIVGWGEEVIKEGPGILYQIIEI